MIWGLGESLVELGEEVVGVGGGGERAGEEREGFEVGVEGVGAALVAGEGEDFGLGARWVDPDGLGLGVGLGLGLVGLEEG